MSLVTNLIPNPLLMLPNGAVSTCETTIQHVDPDGILITPNSGAVNPSADIRLGKPVSGDLHLNFWISQVPEGSRWYENGICYVANKLWTGGVLLPHDNLMTQADWQEYKKLIPRMYALYGDLMPLQN